MILKIKVVLMFILDKLIIGSKIKNYREALFEELLSYSGEKSDYKNILEIGPKDGMDTKRLLTLPHEELCLIDLPSKEESNKQWVNELNNGSIGYYTGNIMYNKFFNNEYFDLIWCTGVLYHNPEQLRMIRILFDLLKPGGVLVIESATVPEINLRNKNVVKIIYPFNEKYKKKYHISKNITHLPSSKAIWSWLKMIGFNDIIRSHCHKKQSIFLSRGRTAYICSKSENENVKENFYYNDTDYKIGRSI